MYLSGSMAGKNKRPRKVGRGRAFAVDKNGKGVEISLRPEGARRIIKDKKGKRWVVIGKLPGQKYLLKPLDEN